MALLADMGKKRGRIGGGAERSGRGTEGRRSGRGGGTVEVRRWE